MKKKSLINYKLFQNRRKFNPINLFTKNKDLTYEEFVEFLRSKMVDTPGLAYFERVKAEFLRRTQAAKEIAKVVKVEVEKVEVEKVEVEKVEVSKQKRRSRRSKKTSIKETQVKEEDLAVETKENSDEKDSAE